MKLGSELLCSFLGAPRETLLGFLHMLTEFCSISCRIKILFSWWQSAGETTGMPHRPPKSPPLGRVPFRLPCLPPPFYSFQVNIQSNRLPYSKLTNIWHLSVPLHPPSFCPCLSITFLPVKSPWLCLHTVSILFCGLFLYNMAQTYLSVSLLGLLYFISRVCILILQIILWGLLINNLNVRISRIPSQVC